MAGNITPQKLKVPHGHPLPDHLNPAKHPEGKLRNDSEAGPSGTTHKKDSAPAPQPNPGQEAPPTLSADVHDRPSRIQREEGGGSKRSSDSSGAFDEIIGLMGGGRYKNWQEFRQSQALSKGERFDLELDKNAYVNAHLNPDLPSPPHAKKQWTKLPDITHPMHADYTIVHNAEYYSFRRPDQHSGPLDLPSQSAAKDHQADPRTTHSTPSGSPRKDIEVDPTLFQRGTLPVGDGEQAHPQPTPSSNEGARGKLLTAQKAIVAGAGGLLVAGLITAATVGGKGGSSQDQGEAQA